MAVRPPWITDENKYDLIITNIIGNIFKRAPPYEAKTPLHVNSRANL